LDLDILAVVLMGTYTLQSRWNALVVRLSIEVVADDAADAADAVVVGPLT
jgi:hypothetical protein